MFAETVSKKSYGMDKCIEGKYFKVFSLFRNIELTDTFDNKYKYIKELYKSRAMIVSRLNMNEDLHKLMYIQINSIDYAKKDNDFFKKRECILELERKVL